MLGLMGYQQNHFDDDYNLQHNEPHLEHSEEAGNLADMLQGDHLDSP
jgi:hypothetical protein